MRFGPARIVKADELKKMYGDEYPVAAIMNGARLPLHCERRFSRSYHSDKMVYEVSRFMDGSASVTASELQREWHAWTDDERMDFCQSCCWLHEQPDFADMLRFIMQHAAPREWSGIAQSVASQLPRHEAYDLLVRALRSMEIGQTSNITQALAITKHPDAETTLRDHLRAIWAHDALWHDDKFLNWVAFDATTCIEYLIELGAAPSDFEQHVRQLARHSCARNRDSCRRFLAKHYSWPT
jgi:hypothetical protein